MADIKLVDVANSYKQLSHQIAALNWLQERQASDVLKEFAEMWRADPAVKEPSPSPGKPSNPLAVPYFPQLDNGPQGWRQCQTSSIAMCLAYLKVPGIKDDVDYLRLLDGDTTSQDTHRRALAKLGVRARFRQDMTAAQLMGEIKAGFPCAIGILHHGSVAAPSGGGHYITAIGFTQDSWIVHDPFGELDLVGGTWLRQGGNAGRSLHYSFKSLNPRWLAPSGWGWVFS